MIVKAFAWPPQPIHDRSKGCLAHMETGQGDILIIDPLRAVPKVTPSQCGDSVDRQCFRGGSAVRRLPRSPTAPLLAVSSGVQARGVVRWRRCLQALLAA